MRQAIAQVTRGIRVERPRATVGLALVALLAAGACDRELTAPVQREPNVRPVSVITITPGLAAYTDRASWDAAVVAASSTPQLFDFTGLPSGRVTQLDTDYSTFHITVDRVAASSFSNPGIDSLTDAGCSIETGTCNRFIFNMLDPDILTGDVPRINSLVFPQTVIGLFGYFFQTGYSVGGTPAVTGPVVMHFGADSVVINDYLVAGNGFFGVVSTNPSTTISFTFQQSGSLQNDIIEVYRPSYAFAPAAPPPDDATAEEQLQDLLTFIRGMTMLKGSASSYADKLDAFAAALAEGRIPKACTELDKFIGKVNDKTARQLTPENAASLTSMANGLKETLNCGGGAG